MALKQRREAHIVLINSSQKCDPIPEAERAWNALDRTLQQTLQLLSVANAEIERLKLMLKKYEADQRDARERDAMAAETDRKSRADALKAFGQLQPPPAEIVVAP